MELLHRAVFRPRQSRDFELPPLPLAASSQFWVDGSYIPSAVGKLNIDFVNVHPMVCPRPSAAYRISRHLASAGGRFTLKSGLPLPTPNEMRQVDCLQKQQLESLTNFARSFCNV